MLQTADLDEDMQEEGQSNLLRPAYYWELVKRRALFIALPFLVIAVSGVAVAMLWPPTYLSEGKILVQSQEIPTELVRPTVTNAAQERIQVIEQRTMTRENLLAIIDKFKLFPEQRNLMSATQLVELMKKRTSIAPISQPLAFTRRTDNPTIVFTVGFEDPDPTTASRVANELVTRILNEDLRDRTSRATETTKFLGRDVQKLQAENAAIEAKVAEAKASQLKPNSSGSDQVAQLRAEYLQKSAIYSEKHPLMKALKRQLEAAEKIASPNGGGGAVDLDALQSQLEASQKNLDTAISKYQAAQLGEALEKNQQSEKLEVIEQPTVPQEPVKPNRPKIIGLSLLLGLAAGGGLTLLLEMLDSTIRRSSDIYSLVESHLVVTVPYIVTQRELLRSKRVRRFVTLSIVPVLVVLLIAVYFLMPPLDLIIAKARVGLIR
jgi:uncharacterized protein involved in exopolysaccharide biosynthesis